MVAETLEQVIEKYCANILERREIPDGNLEVLKTDNLAEVIEKLMILHIRIWMLEDEITKYNESDEDLAAIKRKLDVLFKVKRPNLVAAINKIIEDAVVNGTSIYEESVKVYKEVLDHGSK